MRTKKRCIECIICKSVICQVDSDVINLACLCGKNAMDNRDGSTPFSTVDVDYIELDYDEYMKVMGYEN